MLPLQEEEGVRGRGELGKWGRGCGGRQGGDGGG